MFEGDISSVVIEDGVTYIGARVFQYWDITSVTIPDSVTSIGAGAFEDVEATACYPAGNATWTAEVMQNYSGSITWTSYEASTPGDLNGDSLVDDGDVAQLLWYTLFPDAYEIVGSADYTGDDLIDDFDVAYLLWHTLFPTEYPLN